jgi:hypothetical protein
MDMRVQGMAARTVLVCSFKVIVPNLLWPFGARDWPGC